MRKTPLTIAVPGLHDRALTDAWLRSLRSLGPLPAIAIAPSQVPPYSPAAIDQWLQTLDGHDDHPLVAIGFSAGCVGLRSLLGTRVRRGLSVERFIAIDGWGVPLVGLPFATYRISHDRVSHQTASFLGAGDGAFWAEPAVDHLELWRSPATAAGLCLDPARSATPQPTTAAACILRWAVPSRRTP